MDQTIKRLPLFLQPSISPNPEHIYLREKLVIMCNWLDQMEDPINMSYKSKMSLKYNEFYFSLILKSNWLSLKYDKVLSLIVNIMA